MGDLVHALPMVTDIANVFPDAQIDWVAEESFADVASLHPAVRQVLPVALRRWRRKPFSRLTWTDLRAKIQTIRQHHYDLIIDSQGLIKSALVGSLAKGPVSGFDWNSAREPLASLAYTHRLAVSRQAHAVDRNRQLAALACHYTLDNAPERFGIAQHARQFLVQMPGEACVLLLTHASRATKYWPEEHWLALEAELANLGYVSLLACGSPKERAQSHALAARMRQAIVLPPCRIAELAGYASRSRAVIGLDTGLTHLAAAAGAPTIGIFCDYDPSLVGMRGEGAVRSLGGVNQCPPVSAVLRYFHEIALNRNPS